MEDSIKEVQSAQSLPEKIFQAHARNHLPEMRLLFRGGKLSPKSGDWNNVINHDLVQAAAGEVVAKAIRLPEDQTKTLFKAILVHDWDKRKDIKPGHFESEDLVTAEELLSEVDPDMSVIEATHLGFHNKILSGETTLLQRLQYYLDDITKGEEIAPLEDRLAEVAARRPDIEPEYWVKELEAGKLVEQELFEMLKGNGVDLEDAAKIPDWINAQIKATYK